MRASGRVPCGLSGLSPFLPKGQAIRGSSQGLVEFHLYTFGRVLRLCRGADGPPIEDCSRLSGHLGRRGFEERGALEDGQGRKGFPVDLLRQEDWHHLAGHLLDLRGSPGFEKKSSQLQRDERGVEGDLSGIRAPAAPPGAPPQRSHAHRARVPAGPRSSAGGGHPTDCRPLARATAPREGTPAPRSTVPSAQGMTEDCASAPEADEAHVQHPKDEPHHGTTRPRELPLRSGAETTPS